MASNELRAAVVGAGRLGSLHAAKYATAAGVRLQYVVDIDAGAAAKVASAHSSKPLGDYRELAHRLKGTVDLATVATPCVTHHEIASELLSAGIDVLLEKPMTATIREAQDLAGLAEKSRRVLQIGHLERFNPAIVRLHSIVTSPRFIECHRLAPFTERGTDVDVILDLMIHDLDVVLFITGAEIASVEALGVAVLTDTIDVANARIRFSDGTIANLNASRVAPRRERKIRFFQPDAYVSVDYDARRIQVYRKTAPQSEGGYPTISAEQIDLGQGDPLADEINAFIRCVRTRETPVVSARDGLRVIEACERIRNAMQQ